MLGSKYQVLISGLNIRSDIRVGQVSVSMVFRASEMFNPIFERHKSPRRNSIQQQQLLLLIFDITHPDFRKPNVSPNKLRNSRPIQVPIEKTQVRKQELIYLSKNIFLDARGNYNKGVVR